MDPQLVIEVTKLFENSFHTKAEIYTAAPGRVNLIGEHTDYNDGFVCPLAINKYTVICGKKISGTKSTIISKNVEPSLIEFEINDRMEPLNNCWINYVLGVLDVYKKKFKLADFAIQLAIVSDVPLGGGLSSSAALEVAVATFLETLFDLSNDSIEKAKLCQEAEHLYPKVPCGIMDQYISACGVEGYALLIDCRSFKAQKVSLKDPNVALIVCNSNKKHELNGGEYKERVDSCIKAVKELQTKNPEIAKLRDASMSDLESVKGQLDEKTYMRARHAISEDDRAEACVKALNSGDIKLAGQYLYESHKSLKEDYEVSTVELDTLVDIAKSLDGVYGSRMTGGGFGGCTITLVDAAKKDAIIAAIKSQYKEKTGIECDIFSTTPCQGGQVLHQGECQCTEKPCHCCCFKPVCKAVREHPLISTSVLVAVLAIGAFCIMKRRH